MYFVMNAKQSVRDAVAWHLALAVACGQLGLNLHWNISVLWRFGLVGKNINEVNQCRARLVLGWVTIS